MTTELTTPQLKAAMATKLAESGLNGVDIKKMGLTLLTREQSRELKVPPFSGFRIPYFDVNNKPTKFFRIRYLEDTREGIAKATNKKPLRYVQPPDTGVEVYLPPTIPWTKALANPEQQLIITEGELKAYVACKHKLPAWGLGGVWSFKSSAQLALHLPVFDSISLKNRKVYVIFDSDAATNPQVMKAEQALCRELLRLGAEPYIVRIPTIKEGLKCGLDDYLVSEGEDSLLELMSDAVPYQQASVLYELNTHVAYVRDPGLIVRLENSQRIAPHAFTQHAYATWSYAEEKTLKDGTTVVEEKPAAVSWLKWPHRFEVERVTYAPGRERYIESTNELNAWPGWGCQPAEKLGPVRPWTQLLDHIFSEDRENRRWFEQWCACPLQNPGMKMYTAAVIWSPNTGLGKSLIGYTLMKIYGRNATEINDQHLASPYNEWAENKQFVMGDDVTSGENKKHMADRLKGMITQKELRLNPKYVPSYTVPDCINYYFNSNHPDSFFIEDMDRRYFIYEVNPVRLSREFFKAYVKWMEGDGPSQLFTHLLSIKLDSFDPQADAPRTIAKEEMITDSRSELAEWVRTLFAEPDRVLGNLPGDLWTSQELVALFDPTGNKRITSSSMGKELRRANAVRPCRGTIITSNHGSVRLTAVRNMYKWRKAGYTVVVKHYNDSRGVPVDTRKEKF